MTRADHRAASPHDIALCSDRNAPTRSVNNSGASLCGLWPQPSTIPLVPPDPNLLRTTMTDFLIGGRVVHRDVLEEIYAEINEEFGSNATVP